MRQFYWSIRFRLLYLLLIGIIGLTACGGGDSNNNNNKTITLSLLPTIVSMNGGEVSSLQAQAKDSDGNVVSGDVTWTSDNPSFISLTTSGVKCSADTTSSTTCLCAGTWDANNIVCTGAAGSGTAKITATQGSASASITAFVHPRVARVDVTSPVTDCTSSTGTVQLTATALDSSGNPITVGPADGSGFNWTTSDATVVTSDAKGLATAVNPGVANLFATVSNTVSPPTPFTTCAIKSIKAHVKDATDTSFTADKSTTKTLVADVVDTKDQAITITGSRLAWTSSNLGVASVDQTGIVTTVGAGTTAISVSCSPPTCNQGLTSVFSNPVLANVNGSTTTEVVVASPSSTSLFPINTSTGVVGTAVTLPYNPNSIVYARTGIGAYIGSDTTLMALNGTNNTASAIRFTSGADIPGQVIGVSNDAGLVVVFNNSTSTVTVVSVSNTTTGSNVGQVDRIVISGIPNPCKTTDQCPHASFTPDNKTAYIVAGSNLYISNASASLKVLPLAQAAKDVAVSGQGSFAFVANDNSTIDTFATCNKSKMAANSVALSGVPQRIVSNEDGSKIYVATPPELSVITPTTDATGCPPSLADPLNAIDLGQGTFNTQQLLVSSAGSKVMFLTDGTKVVIYDVAGNSTAAVTLSGSATVLSGGLTLDGAFAYVGGSDKTIHKIDLANNTDAQQIAVTITPDLVAVKPK